MSRLFGLVEVCLAVGAVGVWWVGRQGSAEARRKGWLKYVSYFAIVHGVLAAIYAGTAVRTGLVAVLALLGASEIVAVWRRAGKSRCSVPMLWLSYGAYAVAVLGTTLLFATRPADSLAYLYTLVVVFDGFSQIVGQVVGRHPLAPRLSPGKTREGAAGGLVTTVATAVVLRSLPGFELGPAVAFGLVIAAGALGGDLLASAFKRRNGAKDFGELLPGHGGILDRFDSLFVASCVGLALSSL